MVQDKNIGLYVHVPFCRAKCNYCDFNSFCGREASIPAYFEALKKELELYAAALVGYAVKTIFIGGGTPSLVDSQYLNELMNHCRQYLDISKDAEISMESNPGTLSYGKLVSYREMGINRLSIGLQAWQGNLLAGLGRIHSTEEFVENYKLARKAGFKNINIDLIFGVPGQNLQDWSETLENVVSLEPEHLSCYSLKIEEGTEFGNRLESGELIPLDDELDREMYACTIERLGKSGYRQYEISNFARPGYECRHNLVYWKTEPYVGMGAGAHSYFEGYRYNNLYDVESYIKAVKNRGVAKENVEPIDEKASMSEFMFLGLRLNEGVKNSEFREKYQADVFDVFGEQIHRLVGRKLLEIEGERIRLTTRGLDLANQVFEEFV